MEDEEMEKVAKFLISKGWEIDLEDQLWMEETAFDSFDRLRDIIELLDDYGEHVKASK